MTAGVTRTIKSSLKFTAHFKYDSRHDAAGDQISLHAGCKSLHAGETVRAWRKFHSLLPNNPQENTVIFVFLTMSTCLITY